MSNLLLVLFAISFVMLGVGVIGLISFVLDKKYPSKVTIPNVITTIKKDVIEMGVGKTILLFAIGFLIGLLVIH